MTILDYEVRYMNQKQQKFKELAEKRVNNAIKQLELIGNLSNKNSYEYTEEEVKKIVNTLKAEVRSIENRFNESMSGRKKFKL